MEMLTCIELASIITYSSYSGSMMAVHAFYFLFLFSHHLCAHGYMFDRSLTRGGRQTKQPKN